MLPSTTEEYRYLNPNDAQMRLVRSFIRFNGHVVWVGEVAGDKIHLFDPTGEYQAWVNYNDVRLTISSIPLGWVNIPGLKEICAVYPERLPLRQQKQGVCVRSLSLFVPFSKSGENEFPGIHVPSFLPNFGDGFSIRSFGEALSNKYPSIEDVLKTRLGGAFHRDWAICRPRCPSDHYVLYHKTTPVGYYDARKKSFGLLHEATTKTRKESIESIVSLGGGYTVEEV